MMTVSMMVLVFARYVINLVFLLCVVIDDNDFLSEMEISVLRGNPRRCRSVVA